MKRQDRGTVARVVLAKLIRRVRAHADGRRQLQHDDLRAIGRQIASLRSYVHSAA